MQDIPLEDLLKQLAQKNKESKKPNPNKVGQEIISEHTLIYYGDSFFSYRSGKYQKLSETQLKHIVGQKVKDLYRPAFYKEIYECMLKDCVVENINTFKGLNLLNGVLEFETMSLIPHNPSYYFTTQIQANYTADVKCDRWLAFLHEMLGDDTSKIDVLQEYSGYCLDPNINLELVLFLLGRGANGKSVFCDAIKGVYGSGNYDTISLDDLKNKNYVADLVGKLINISTESQAKAEVYESNLKRLASAEEIKVDRKFKDPFSFKSNCKHIYSLNNLPRVGDKSDGFFRRIITIPFNRQVDNDKKIQRLGQIIAEDESAGILNWMIEGYKRLKQNRWQFTQCKQALELMKEYRKDNNNVISFVEECCEFGPEANYYISNQAIYDAYTKWCKESGVQPIKKKTFIDEILYNFKHEGVYRYHNSAERGLKRIVLGVSPSQDFSEPF